MIPMETASNFVKPKTSANANVKKIPNWPAAPRRKIFGFSRRGPNGHGTNAHKDKKRK
jgi:hypothetical protein